MLSRIIDCTPCPGRRPELFQPGITGWRKAETKLESFQSTFWCAISSMMGSHTAERFRRWRVGGLDQTAGGPCGAAVHRPVSSAKFIALAVAKALTLK
jgi:hypothetical protein